LIGISTPVDITVTPLAGKHSHSAEIQSRLSFLSFILNLIPDFIHSTEDAMILMSIIHEPINEIERELGWEGFIGLNGNGYLIKHFVENEIPCLNLKQLGKNGFKFLEKAIWEYNLQTDRISNERVVSELIGIEALWGAVLGSDRVGKENIKGLLNAYLLVLYFFIFIIPFL